MSATSRPAALSEDLWAIANRVGTAAVSDVLNAQGVFNKALKPGIGPLMPGSRLIGAARTMVSRPRETAPDPGREYAMLFEAIDGMLSGEVLVTDAMDCCVWGELCAERARMRGANGTLIDGFHRDTAELRRLGWPVFSRGAHPSDMLYHREIVAIDQPVHCGGVYVASGDLIIADEDGVVVVPSGHVAAALEAAGSKAALETEVRNALREGASAAQAYERFGVF